MHIFLSPMLMSVSVFGLYVLYADIETAVAVMLWIIFNIYVCVDITYIMRNGVDVYL
jgi:hypothetical protein